MQKFWFEFSIDKIFIGNVWLNISVFLFYKYLILYATSIISWVVCLFIYDKLWKIKIYLKGHFSLLSENF